MSAFLPTPSDLQRHTVDVGGPTVERAHQCGIDGELHAPKQRETFSDNFQPSAIECLWCQWASRHTLATAFSTTKPVLTLTAHTLHDDGPKESSWRPHRQVRTVGGRGRRSLRSSKTRKRWGGIRVGKHEGVADNAPPENGPLCDLIRAFSLSLNTGINECSVVAFHSGCGLVLPSCPPRTWLELIWKRRARTMQDSMPRGWLETHDTGQLFRAEWAATRGWSCTNSETLPECVCIAVSVVEHAQ